MLVSHESQHVIPLHLIRLDSPQHDSTVATRCQNTIVRGFVDADDSVLVLKVRFDKVRERVL